MKKVLLAAILAAPAGALAQQAIDLNPVSVTASRTTQKTNETGRSITVINGKLFEQLPVNTVDELLKYVPGVEIQQRGPAGSQSDIVLRGSTFQQVLVLIDGIKINDPVTGHFSSYMPIAPYEIERIELLRGPAAAIYGTEAVGGVINIISKTFNRFNTVKTTKAGIGAAAGEYGFFSADAGIYHTSPKINIAAGGSSNNAEGQLLRGSNRGFFHTNTISASVNIPLNKHWQLLLRSSYDDRDFAAQNFYTTFASDTATEKVSSWWNQAKLRHSGKTSTDEIDIAYKQTKDHYAYNKTAIANDNRSGYALLQYIHSGRLSSRIKISYGAAADNRAIRSNDRGNHQTWHGAVFSSLHYAAGKWHIQPSLRVDMDENYGTELLPQLNLSWLLKSLTLRANAGRAIRSADYTERYNNYGKKLVTGGSIGNPDLTAERSWNYEAGADLLLDKWKLSATGFYRDQKDVIDWAATAYADMPRKDNLSPTGTYALARNTKKVYTSGIELEAAYSAAFAANHNLYANIGATFLHSSSSDAIPSFYIISHARTMVQGNIIYSWKGLTLALNGIYKKREGQKASAINAEITKEYFLVNTKLQYAFGKRFSAFVSVNNTGNIAYSDLLGSKMPGRWTTAGARLSF